MSKATYIIILGLILALFCTFLVGESVSEIVSAADNGTDDYYVPAIKQADIGQRFIPAYDLLATPLECYEFYSDQGPDDGLLCGMLCFYGPAQTNKGLYCVPVVYPDR